MRLVKRTLLALFLGALIALLPAALAVTPDDYAANAPEKLTPEHLYGLSCILVNADTGEVLLEKDADSKRYPASTTKIMTCILAIESGLVGTRITIPYNIAVPYDSSRMGLTSGDEMSFTDLLYGMMIASGNDASVAVAMLVSGSESEFVNLMNAKAQELGMTGTHFVNSHGYQKANHYTTARDLATLTSYAMQNDLFREIVATTSYTMYTSYHPEGWTFSSKYDPMLSDKPLYYDKCIGVKTGFTSSAGHCFVGAAEDDGLMFISVSLNTDKADDTYSQTFTDTVRMLKYGFTQYQSLSFRELYSLCDDSLLKSIEVKRAAKTDPNKGILRMNELSVADMPADYNEWYLKSDLQDVLFQSMLAEQFATRLTFVLNGEPTAPIAQGDVLGKVLYAAPNGETLEGTLVASRDVEMEPLSVDEIMDQWIEEHAPWMFKLMPRHNPPVRAVYWALLAVIVALIVWRVRRVRKRNRERRMLLEKKRREYLRRQKQREAYLRAHPEAARKAQTAAKKGARKR